MFTVSLDPLLAKSAFLLTDHTVTIATDATRDGSGTISALIVFMIVVMAVMLRLFRRAIGPVMDIVKAVAAGMAALLLAGAVVVMLVAALVMTA
jgi:hypothetical protein